MRTSRMLQVSANQTTWEAEAATETKATMRTQQKGPSKVYTKVKPHVLPRLREWLKASFRSCGRGLCEGLRHSDWAALYSRPIFCLRCAKKSDIFARERRRMLPTH